MVVLDWVVASFNCSREHSQGGGGEEGVGGRFELLHHKQVRMLWTVRTQQVNNSLEFTDHQMTDSEIPSRSRSSRSVDPRHASACIPVVPGRGSEGKPLSG
jgi:hypothetical protein